MTPWLNGEVISAAAIKRLSRRLGRVKVSIISNDWAIQTLGRLGAEAQFVRFKDGSAAILLRPLATRYQLVHELKHFEHWLRGPSDYAKMGRLEREEFVYKRLQESNHWRRFNVSEKAHALEYIKYIRLLHQS